MVEKFRTLTVSSILQYMDRIYLDNAATTPMDPLVLDAMMPFLTEKFGNPSSIYSYGRETRLAIENARKSIARGIGIHPGELFFTSGGTESINKALNSAVCELGCRRIVTSPIEHHATLHTIEHLQKTTGIQVQYLPLTENGHVPLDILEDTLASSSIPTLVSLMHGNNEIGNLLDMEQTSRICEHYKARFFCDTVQTIAHYPLDLSRVHVDFIACSAHKFHGPKGVGFLYINERNKISPLLYGGSQERNMRAGTENVYGIVGMARAIELATQSMDKDKEHISNLKQYMALGLKQQIPDIRFNGDWEGASLYTVLNVGFPNNQRTEMILMNLDIHGICASGGSACSSGASTGSHVIEAVYRGIDQVAVRFSFSKYNTLEELDQVVRIIADLV